jgi:hypothetical protein
MKRTILTDERRLKSIGYDADRAIMQVEFPVAGYPDADGPLYDYFNIPGELFSELMAAPAGEKGKYFAAHIQGPDRKSPLFKFSKHITDPGLPNVRPAGAKIVPFEGDQQGKPTAYSVVEDRLLRQHPTAIDAQAKAQVASAPAAEILAPSTPLPTDYAGLVKRTETVRERVQALIKGEGVKVALVVANADGYRQVAELFKQLTAEKKEVAATLEAAKKVAYAPYQVALNEEKTVLAGYAILGTLEKAMVNWKAEQDRLTREAEQAENRRRQAVAQAATEAAALAARQQAEKDAAAMEAVGQPEVAQVIRQAPLQVVEERAAPAVYAREVPKVDGLRETGSYKFRVDSEAQVPLYFKDRIRQAINDEAARSKPGETISEERMGNLTIAIAAILSDFYSLDQVKLGGFLRPKKAAGINLVPGVTVWNESRISSTGK